MNIEIQALPYVSMSDLPLFAELTYLDIKLTFGEGMTMYTKEETLDEIDSHHSVDDTTRDFTHLIQAVQSVPAGVYFCW